MRAGILLITHGELGGLLLETVAYMLGGPPEQAGALAVDSDRTVEELDAEARGLVRDLDHGSGVLVLTDLVGATPANIASRLRGHGAVAVVCGVNLAMLVKAISYRETPLDELAEKAAQGGRDGIAVLLGDAG